jgi:hypothetical protein
MGYTFKKASGVSLCLGSLLAAGVMVLHPTGGSIDYIVKIQNVLIFSHSLGIACLPVICFGAWGLTNLLETNSRISFLSFFIFCFGLIAAMIAATFNGLVLPQFLNHSLRDVYDTGLLEIVVSYGHQVNKAMASLFIAATSISILIWSLLIVGTSQFPSWSGYLGIFLIAIEAVGLFLDSNFTSVHNFSFFVGGLVLWLIVIGMQMRFSK